MKNRVEIFDLEKTLTLLETAKTFMRSLARDKKTLLLVGGKPEARVAIEEAAKRIAMPYVMGRWIGGTLTNFSEVRRRIARLEELRADRETGDYVKRFTKKERLLLDREIERLERNFGGIVSMPATPAAILVIDPREEHTAMREAKRLRIPVIAIAGSDCDIASIDYPVVGNDASRKSIAFLIHELVEAYEEGKKE